MLSPETGEKSPRTHHPTSPPLPIAFPYECISFALQKPRAYDKDSGAQKSSSRYLLKIYMPGKKILKLQIQVNIKIVLKLTTRGRQKANL